MNRIGLVSEVCGNKNTHINERMFCCLILRNIINGRTVVESAEKYKEIGKDKRKNIKY